MAEAFILRRGGGRGTKKVKPQSHAYEGLMGLLGMYAYIQR